MLFLEPKHNPCDSSPCKNGGTCDNEGDSFLCNCAEDFEGETCEGILKASCTLFLEYFFYSNLVIREYLEQKRSLSLPGNTASIGGGGGGC